MLADAPQVSGHGWGSDVLMLVALTLFILATIAHLSQNPRWLKAAPWLLSLGLAFGTLGIYILF